MEAPWIFVDFRGCRFLVGGPLENPRKSTNIAPEDTEDMLNAVIKQLREFQYGDVAGMEEKFKKIGSIMEINPPNQLDK